MSASYGHIGKPKPYKYHISGKHGECSAQKPPKHGVCGYGRVSVHSVHVDQVIETLHKNEQNTASKKRAGYHLRNPGDVRI